METSEADLPPTENAPFRVPTIGEAVEAADADDREEGIEGLDEIKDSMCMVCGGNGTTRMLTTKIPFFREIILSSFECDECQWTNNEVVFGGELQEKGCRFELLVSKPEDLDRQVIKSDYATITFVEVEFEIPPRQRGEVTTVEGLLRSSAERLGEAQDIRMEQAPEIGLKVAQVIAKLTTMCAGFDSDFPFTMVVDDPSGNSFVENPSAPNKDPALSTYLFTRSAAQDLSLGLQPSKEAMEAGGVDDTSTAKAQPRQVAGAAALLVKAKGGDVSGKQGCAGDSADGEDGDGEDALNFMRREAVRLPEHCPACGAPGESLTCIAEIPHFKEVMIMAFDCEQCGFKSSEVKGGGAIPDKGTSHSLTATSLEDLRRDVLKSDTAVLEVPELELVMEMGTLGSMYTTVEGLLTKAYSNLVEGNPFFSGDSATEHHGKESETQRRFREFLERFRDLMKGGKLPFTLRLRDPMGNSFIGSLEYENPVDDPNMTVEWYERSFEENEELGLNDMKTEGFETIPEDGEPYSSKGAAPVHLLPHRVETDHPTPFTKGQEEADDTRTDGIRVLPPVIQSGSGS